MKFQHRLEMEPSGWMKGRASGCESTSVVGNGLTSDSTRTGWGKKSNMFFARSRVIKSAVHFDLVKWYINNYNILWIIQTDSMKFFSLPWGLPCRQVARGHCWVTVGFWSESLRFCRGVSTCPCLLAYTLMLTDAPTQCLRKFKADRENKFRVHGILQASTVSSVAVHSLDRHKRGIDEATPTKTCAHQDVPPFWVSTFLVPRRSSQYAPHSNPPLHPPTVTTFPHPTTPTPLSYPLQNVQPI